MSRSTLPALRRAYSSSSSYCGPDYGLPYPRRSSSSTGSGPWIGLPAQRRRASFRSESRRDRLPSMPDPPAPSSAPPAGLIMAPTRACTHCQSRPVSACPSLGSADLLAPAARGWVRRFVGSPHPSARSYHSTVVRIMVLPAYRARQASRVRTRRTILHH